MTVPRNLQLLRSANRMAIVRAIRVHHGLSRAALAEYVGLTKPGVGQLLEGLIEDGWIAQQLGPPSAGRGRPAMQLTLADNRFAFIGASFNEQGNRVVATTLQGDVLESAAQDAVCIDVEAALAGLAEQIAVLHKRLVTNGFKVLGVGVGAPGPVRPQSGRLYYSERSQWSDVPIRELLGAKLEILGLSTLQVVVERGVGCIALHQFDLERTSSEEPLLYLRIGHNISAAVAGKTGLWRGARGLVGTVSHMQVVPDGPRCYCGRIGCANVTVTLGAVEQRLGIQIRRPEDIDYGQTAVREALDCTGELLGNFIRNLCLVYDPARVFVGGSALQISPHLIHAAQQSFERIRNPWNIPVPRIEVAQLEENVMARGAAVALIDAIVGGRY